MLPPFPSKIINYSTWALLPTLCPHGNLQFYHIIVLWGCVAKKCLHICSLKTLNSFSDDSFFFFFWFGKICKRWWECVQIREQVCIMVKIILQNLETGGGNEMCGGGEGKRELYQEIGRVASALVQV